MPSTRTPEEIRALQAANAAALAAHLEWFDGQCRLMRPLWDGRIKQILRDDPKRPRVDIEGTFAKNAADDLKALDAEISSMLVRTSIIVAAATLLFAVYAFRSNVGAVFLVVALTLAAIAFIVSVRPMAPPLRRAWKEPYNKRAVWTLAAHDHFRKWVRDCWLADRRTPVITKYKRAHSLAVRLLVWAAIVAIPGMALSVLH